MKSKVLRVVIAGATTFVATGLVLAGTASASGITVYRDNDRYVKVGGNIQVQYHLQDPKNGSSTDDLFFRRLRPFIEGSIYKDWAGRFEWDMGNSSGTNEIEIKDAYVEYTGYEGVDVKIGNSWAPFSREGLTSSKKQQFVEKTLAGDHNYGSPFRNLGVHAKGRLAEGRVSWAASASSADIDPDSSKLDFDTPINRDTDFNQGWMLSGRVDYHPFGYLARGQGDFERTDLRATAGVGAYVWKNDGDNNTYTVAGSDTSAGATPDVDKVTGLEVSGALRYHGISVDAEYNIFNADTVDASVTAGIYRNGTTRLTNYVLKGGYMVLPGRLELVAGYEAQDADNYATTWGRTSLGANYFIRKHDIKAQITYRIGKDLNGVRGSDENELFVQTQYAF